MITDDSGNAGTTQTVALTGVGTGPAASVTPSSLTFPSQPVNSTSAGQNVTLQNTGTGTMTVNSVSTAAPFSQSSSCGSIAAGGACNITVYFTPTAMGSANRTLTISDNAGTQTVSLSGTGSAPVTLSASSLNFGSVRVKSTSAAQTVTLKNLQAVTLKFTSIATTAGFKISSNSCGSSIGGSASCSVGVTFSPTARGTFNGKLTFTDNAVNSPQVVTLTGTGK